MKKALNSKVKDKFKKNNKKNFKYLDLNTSIGHK